MLRRAFQVMCVIAVMGLAASSGLAQEGHPLTGTWSGDWGTNASQRNHLTVVMNWDGDKLTGTMNPGPDAVTLANITVDYATWTVRIEGDTKDQAGAPAHFVAEGRLDDIGSYHRTLGGTWTQGAAKGNFKITRD
jgi:hypothetical protein